MKNKEQIGSIIKDKLVGHEVRPPDSVWQNISVHLDHHEEKKRGRYFLLGGLLIILLVVIGASAYFLQNDRDIQFLEEQSISSEDLNISRGTKITAVNNRENLQKQDADELNSSYNSFDNRSSIQKNKISIVGKSISKTENTSTLRSHKDNFNTDKQGNSSRHNVGSSDKDVRNTSYNQSDTNSGGLSHNQQNRGDQVNSTSIKVEDKRLKNVLNLAASSNKADYITFRLSGSGLDNNLFNDKYNSSDDFLLLDGIVLREADKKKKYKNLSLFIESTAGFGSGSISYNIPNRDLVSIKNDHEKILLTESYQLLSGLRMNNGIGFAAGVEFAKVTQRITYKDPYKVVDIPIVEEVETPSGIIYDTISYQTIGKYKADRLKKIKQLSFVLLGSYEIGISKNVSLGIEAGPIFQLYTDLEGYTYADENEPVNFNSLEKLKGKSNFDIGYTASFTIAYRVFNNLELIAKPSITRRKVDYAYSRLYPEKHSIYDLKLGLRYHF